MLKDDEDLSKLPLKDGASIMLIGTAEVVKEPQEKVTPLGADAAAFGVWSWERFGPSHALHKHPLQKPPHSPQVVFVEDMTQAEASKAGAVLPAGFRNLGNTCYMNSTLQVFIWAFIFDILAPRACVSKSTGVPPSATRH